MAPPARLPASRSRRLRLTRVAQTLCLAAVTWVALAQAETATVRHALDGDSLVLTDGRPVRLIGINAPEIGVDGRPDQPLARAAQRRLAEWVVGRSVTLRFDNEKTDRHGRALAYVARADGADVQAQLAREGLAWCVAIPPNTAHAADYCAAEREARAAKRGVWAEPSYQPAAVERLGPTDTGFRLVTGTIRRIGSSRHAIYLDLAPHFSVVIPRAAWTKFPSELRPARGQTLVARGWVTEYKNGLRLRIAHPAMLEILR